MIKNIIFDFNGTMIFDDSIQKKAWLEIIHNKTGRNITEEEFSLHVAGKTNSDTFKYYLPKDLSDTQINSLSAKKESIYQKLCLQDQTHFKLVKGLSDFLDWCISNDISLNIATASEMNNVKFFFKHLNLAKWFDINSVSFNDGMTPGKPAPDIFIRGMNKIGADPRETMIIEDSKSGILAARNAEVGKVVQICEKNTSIHLLGADQLISDYVDLLMLMS